MPANTAPIYVKAPRVTQVKLTTGSSTFDGSAATPLFVAGADGSRVERIRAMPVATTVASKLLVYVKEGGDFTLLQDWPLASIGISNTNSSGNADVPMNINIPVGAEIWIQLTVASAWDITAIGGDF